METLQTLEIPVRGMDCHECTQHVKHALLAVPGVEAAEVFLTAERARVQFDPGQVVLADLRNAVQGAGYSIPEATDTPGKRESALQRAAPAAAADQFSRQAVRLFVVVFGAVLFIVIAGEWLGLFDAINALIPAPLGLLAVVVAGFPIFRNVIRAALRRQVLAHTLMTVGVLAALLVGEWVTAAVVVFLMRVGNYAERFTAERARRAVKDLTAMAPQMARVERDGREVEIAARDVTPGEIVIVRPGEQIPVDGIVLDGQATVNQAAITGESMPVEASAGAKVYAATVATLGHLRVQATHAGADTTFGRVIRMVEEAEAHRADVQRIADRFSSYYLPVVMAVAAVTYLISRNPLSTAAVLVVACSCSFALATPIAMLASIGAGAKRGLLIKGGKYIELLAQADVLLIDKTGTLTLGKPHITDVVSLNGLREDQVLALAASAERYSEHPLAEAVRVEAEARGLTLSEPTQFQAVPGQGVRAQIDGLKAQVGNFRLITSLSRPAAADEQVARLESQGKTLLYVARDEELVGLLAAADQLRPEVPAAMASLRAMGIRRIELLTGDNEQTAAAIAGALGISYRANLLPEDKIAAVKRYQADGHTVVMVGDGVNDAPALAQAQVGIAMGAAGSDVAIEAAHVALMREDWSLVPQVFRIARRTMRVVRMNIFFTAVYNFFGLTLAAVGLLPPILAAAAQSLPDLGILGNSARLMRQQASEASETKGHVGPNDTPLT